MTDDSSQRCVPFFRVPERAVLALGLTLGGLAQASGIRLGLAESCTGGLAASWVTAVPGSSHWFEGGIVSYSNAFKSAALGVSEELLATHGAVSRPVAQAMAHGLRHRLMGTPQHPLCKGWATAAITGVAGPTGGSLKKPLGLVWFGWEFPDQSAHQEACIFSGDRQAIQRQAAWWSLQRLAWGLTRPPA